MTDVERSLERQLAEAKARIAQLEADYASLCAAFAHEHRRRRDQAACAALTGMLANHDYKPSRRDGEGYRAAIHREAQDHADGLLDALDRTAEKAGK